ncbi:uncharacterized protein ACLA_093310 [Aspergillus clavatus NRRL 1]|uniref:Protein kinase domain-containing protein n=1 Tax=Aspergillus clavatus (strain ATCC 1007 / CBS 513.65 / DSM 816 / NCTC 3887 / NRRL 1 / QM 1276 / 107) TaxID=344612 RepID=A1CFI3_ASPCL|nr:uncharacterized protein ACLA_093310 [Aspergillus clavatus NRRL 1]EAW11632.1 hypothetical protein ACLA_093310 [Aspergillus clavatus NRRL 1]
MEESTFLYDYPPNTETSLLIVHTVGWLHRNICSENILFFKPKPTTAAATPLTHPYLTGFTFSRADSPVEISDQASEDPLLGIYRHPAALGEPTASYAMYMAHYSLGAVLVEIAEWRPLKHIVKKHIDVTRGEVDVSLAALAGIQGWLGCEPVERGQVAFRMGEVYGRAVSWLLMEGTEHWRCGWREWEWQYRAASGFPAVCG